MEAKPGTATTDDASEYRCVFYNDMCISVFYIIIHVHVYQVSGTADNVRPMVMHAKPKNYPDRL